MAPDMNAASYIAVGLGLTATGLYLGGDGGVVVAAIGVFVALKPFFGGPK
jgi:hypothetical protein